MNQLHCGPYRISLTTPIVMGVLNATPDSFSQDGFNADPQRALDQALRFKEEGAAMVDVGGESTRPGAQAVSAVDEIRRVVPVIEAVASVGLPISIDTWKPEVMQAALQAGACLINDINALNAPGALEVAAASAAAVCLMHKQGTPLTMQHNPVYQDVVGEVCRHLDERAQAARHAGLTRERIVLDPGFGFGKTLEHSLALLHGLDHITALGYPVLAGLSRKSMLGAITGRPVGERVHASIAAALFAVSRGARIIRAHDVSATRDALAVWAAASTHTT